MKSAQNRRRDDSLPWFKAMEMCPGEVAFSDLEFPALNWSEGVLGCTTEVRNTLKLTFERLLILSQVQPKSARMEFLLWTPLR